MPLAAIASAASSIIGGVAQSNAAGKAADAQNAASQANIANSNQILGNVANDVNPTIGYGNAAGGELAGLLGTGGNPAQSASAFKNYLGSTNYNFLLDQGLQGQSYLNAPNLFSGATGKAFNNYAQGMAGNALYGYEGLLQNQQSLGLQGSSIYANAGTNIAAQNANARNLGAGATGTAALAQGQIFNNALSGVGNLLSSSSYGGGGSAFGGGASNNFGTAQYTGLPNPYTMGTGLGG